MPKRRFEAFVSDSEPVVSAYRNTETGAKLVTWTDCRAWFKDHMNHLTYNRHKEGKFFIFGFKPREYWDREPKDKKFLEMIQNDPQFMLKPLQDFGNHHVEIGYNSNGMALKTTSFNGNISPFLEHDWSAITQDNEIDDGYMSRRTRFLAVSFFDNRQECVIEIQDNVTGQGLYKLIPKKWKEGSSDFTLNLQLVHRILLDHAGLRVRSKYKENCNSKPENRLSLIFEDLYGCLTTFEDQAFFSKGAKLFLEEYFNLEDFTVELV